MTGTKTTGTCPCVCHKLPMGAVVHVVPCCQPYQNRTESGSAGAGAPEDAPPTRQGQAAKAPGGHVHDKRK